MYHKSADASLAKNSLRGVVYSLEQLNNLLSNAEWLQVATHGQYFMLCSPLGFNSVSRCEGGFLKGEKDANLDDVSDKTFFVDKGKRLFAAAGGKTYCVAHDQGRQDSWLAILPTNHVHCVYGRVEDSVKGRYRIYSYRNAKTAKPGEPGENLNSVNNITVLQRGCL